MDDFEYRCGRGHSPVAMRVVDGSGDGDRRLYRCPTCSRESWVKMDPDGTTAISDGEAES